jgi:hypothetical protein
MNPIQKQWLALGAAVMAAMLIYPPWVKITHIGPQVATQESAGYSWLSEPPKANTSNAYTSIRIDYALLVSQWAVTAFVIGAGLLFFKGSDKKSLAEFLSSGGGSAKPDPPSNPPKPRPPPDSPSSKAQVSLAATLNQAEQVLRQAPPISEKPLPTDVGSRKHLGPRQ